MVSFFARAHVGDHHHHHAHASHRQTQRNLRIALILNLSFAVVELVGGICTNSVAILSDALHDFGDALSLAVASYLQKVSLKPRDQFYSYGYKRFSLLGALVVSVVLVIGLSFVVQESVMRLFRPEPANAKGMLWLALLGILVNGIAALRVKSGHSFTERAAYLHLLEDVLGWIAVLISSVVMLFFDLPFMDPLISLAIAAFVLFNVFKNLRSVVKILLLEVPEHMKVTEIQEKIRRLKGVKEVDDLHLWTLDGDNNVITMQVIVTGRESFTALRKLKQQIRQLVSDYGIYHSTIEFCTHHEDNHQHH